MNPPPLKRLILSVLVYMALALIAGMIAIAENLPAEFGGSSTGFQSSHLPRSIRWLGWIMAFGILVPEWIFPGFLLVILLSLPWLFLLGRWMKRLTFAPKEVL